jgi:hypothetical protein
MKTHWGIPTGPMDKKTLERIKLKQMVTDLKSWIKIDSEKRYNFGIIDNIRNLLNK